MYNIKLFYEKYKKEIFIILVLMNLFFIYPYLINTIYPKKNFDELPLGKLYIKYIHGSEMSDNIFGLVYLLLNVMILYEIYKKDDLSKTSKIIILCSILYIYTVVLVPLLSLYNIYLKLYYNNPAYIEDVNKEFEKNAIIENNFELYHDELMRFMSLYDKIDCIHDNVPGFVIGKSADKCWRVLHIMTARKFIPNFEKICPELYKILKDKRVYNAFLSILDGKVNIPIHTGYSRALLRYHVGIVIPNENGKKSYIVCNNIKYEWSRGKGVIFDDMYPHYVENPCNSQRIVLYIDLIRKDLVESPINNLIASIAEKNYIIQEYNKKQHVQKEL